MNKKYSLKRGLALTLSMLMLCAPCVLAEENDDDRETPAYFKEVEVMRGTLNAEMKVNMRKSANKDASVITRIAPGEVFDVLDASDEDWVKVKYDGKVGFVAKDYVEIATYTDQVELIIEDPLEVTVSELSVPTLLDYHESFTLEGILTSNIPILGVSVDIIDRRTTEVAMSAAETFAHEEEVKTYSLKRLDGDLKFRKLTAGEKKLVVTVTSADDSVVALEQDFYVKGTFGDLASMTGDCTITSTSGKKSNLTDNRYDTACSLDSESDSVTVAIPDGKNAALITLSWSKAPSSFRIVTMDGEDNIISTINEDNMDGRIGFSYDLTASTKKILIATPDSSCGGICELRVYEEGTVSDLVQQWQPIEGKVDLMVISAHQDDEMLFFGGTIPYYVAQGKNVVVVYMANCSRERYAEAMDGLWSCGLKNHPVFVGFEDKRLSDYDDTVELWGLEKTEETLVSLIRQYQPDVIVTHDIDGEYGHNQHKLTSAAVRRAVLLAADAETYEASADKYGIWDTKKLYVHLYEGNEIMMNVYDQPLDALNGLSPTQVATIGFSKHVSQQKYFSMEKTGREYDNRKYGLIRTTVDYDVLKNDFFENIDSAYELGDESEEDFE